MKYTKQEVETALKDMLYEMLRDYNQEGSVISLDYDEEKQECILKMTVCIVEEDNYIGFAAY